MGIFSKMTGNRGTVLAPKAALALAAMTMIGADGSVEDEELASLEKIVRGDSNAFEQAHRAYKDLSVLESADLVNKSLDQEQKVAVIANILDIAMADGLLAGAEEQLMHEYLNRFGLPEPDVKKLIDVIALKNDFSVFERPAQATGDAQATVYCSKCGKPGAPGAAFCQSCGTRII
jgi:uncharacterized tellurite resistance protein B-like protein